MRTPAEVVADLRMAARNDDEGHALKLQAADLLEILGAQVVRLRYESNVYRNMTDEQRVVVDRQRAVGR